MSIEITPEQVSSHERIGHVGDDPVYHIACRGGWHVVAALAAGSSKPRILGAGSLMAVARHIARKQEPKLVLTQLQKSEDVSAADMARHLPFGRALTARLQERHG